MILRPSKRFTGLSILVFLLAVQSISVAGRTRTIEPGGPPPSVSAKAVVIMDDATGTILFSKNPDLVIPPASLTKLVTLDVVYDDLEPAGRARMLDEVPLRSSKTTRRPSGSTVSSIPRS